MGITVDETKAANVDEIRAARRELEGIISNALRQFQCQYGVKVASVEEGHSVTLSSGLGVNSVRLRVEL